MQRLTIGQIKVICKEFLEALGESATEDLLFPILAEMSAQEYNLTLTAEQRGIRGTFIHFVKES